MTPRGFDSLMAALIRIGLLLALVIMLIAENAHAQSLSTSASECKAAGFRQMQAQTRSGAVLFKELL